MITREGNIVGMELKGFSGELENELGLCKLLNSGLVPLQIRCEEGISGQVF